MYVKQLTPPAVVALLFLAFGAAWILGTDSLLELYTSANPHLLVTIGKLKGSAFVAAASLLIYSVVRHFHHRYLDSLAHASGLAQRYQGLYNTISDGVIEYDYTTDTCSINAYLQEQFKCPSDIVDNAMRRHLAAIHPNDKVRVTRTMEKYYDTPGEPWQITYRYLWSDGTYHTMISRGFNIANGQTGKTERCMIVMHDVTARSNIKSELVSRETQARKEKSLMVVKAQEEERNRLAMELHDNIGQLVSVAKLYCEHQVAATDDAVANKMHMILSEASDAIRRLSADMKPPEFAHGNLAQAIQALADRVCKVNHLDIAVNCCPMFGQHISAEHKLMVYRIIQEQLNNVLKYAQAKQVTIVLNEDDGEARVSITDDGVGFDPAAKATGIGLSNMRSRLKLFDGDLIVQSAKGQGCTLTAVFPLS